MASRPFFDKAQGKWRMKWWAGKERGWLIVSLCRHPGAWSKSRPPKIPPPEAQLLAQKYRDLEIKARHGVSVAPIRGHNLAEHLAAYRTEFEVRAAKGSLPQFDRPARLFLAHCAATKVTTLEAVTPAVCRAFLASRAREGRLHATIATERGMLSPVWTQAKLDGIVTSNPWESAPVPVAHKQEAPPYWTRDELDRLVSACSGWVRDLILVGANTGLRISALLGLEWRDVSFERGVVVVRAGESKSGRRYEVPMSATCNEVLARRWVMNSPGQRLVFPGPRSGRRMRSKAPYDRIEILVKKTGIPDYGAYNHILRHTFASHAVMSGVPLLIVSCWLGHSSVKMTERYAHLIPGESHRQMQSFDLRPRAREADGTPSLEATRPSPSDD